MLRGNFREHIKKLEEDIKVLSDMVITAINRSTEALMSRNIEQAKKISADDELINSKRYEIEESCIHLIALQQPVATDLREIIAILNITTELERMGDYADGNAKIVVLLGNESFPKPLTTLALMSEKSVSMLKRSIEAFINRDAKAATAICNEDDDVDRLHDQWSKELLKYMIDSPEEINKSTYLVWAGHNLERIADRVTNICERIIFLVTGILHQENVSKY